MPMKKGSAGGEAQIRTFVAIDISDEARSNLDEVIDELKPRVAGVKWVRSKGIHLTLKFLGNVPESMISSIGSVLEETSGRVKPFDVSVNSLGAFPNPRRARVIWVGLDEPTGNLSALAKNIDRGMETLGFEPESREFRPHLTIGRVRKSGF